MSFIKSPGLILHKIPFSETSIILKVYTRESGLISLIAKGAKRPKSKFRGLLDAFHELQFMYPEKSKSELLILSEATFLSDFPQIKIDPSRQALACLVLEVYLRYLHGPLGHEPLYALLFNTLKKIENERDPASYSLLLNTFLLHFCAQLGFSPQLGQCVYCGKPITDLKVAMHVDLGGPICNDCHRQHREASQPLRLNVLQWLHALQSNNGKPEKISSLEEREAEAFIFSFLGNHSGGEKKLKSLEFYRHMQLESR